MTTEKYERLAQGAVVTFVNRLVVDMVGLTPYGYKLIEFTAYEDGRAELSLAIPDALKVVNGPEYVQLKITPGI